MSEPKAWNCGVCGQAMSGWIPACVPCVTKATNPDPPEGLEAPTDVQPVNPDGRMVCSVQTSLDPPYAFVTVEASVRDPGGVAVASRKFKQPLDASMRNDRPRLERHLQKLRERVAESLRVELGFQSIEWRVG